MVLPRLDGTERCNASPPVIRLDAFEANDGCRGQHAPLHGMAHPPNGVCSKGSSTTMRGCAASRRNNSPAWSDGVFHRSENDGHTTPTVTLPAAAASD